MRTFDQALFELYDEGLISYEEALRNADSANELRLNIKLIEKRRSRAAPSVTAMDITIHSSFLPHTDPDASLAFYRDTLGFEVRNDVGYEGMRWITVGPADQPGTNHRPAPAGRRPRASPTTSAAPSPR
jgi:hypothetical protein